MMIMTMIADESNKSLIRNMLNDFLNELQNTSQHQVGGDSNDLPAYPLFDEYFNDLDHRYPFILMKNGDVIGFYFLHKFDDNPFEITEFYLKPSYRQQGFGREAFEKIKGFCISIEKHATIQVRCFKENKDANNFWRKLGFKLVTSDELHHIYQYQILKVKRWVD